jgi:hypothetical protein
MNREVIGPCELYLGEFEVIYWGMTNLILFLRRMNMSTFKNLFKLAVMRKKFKKRKMNI